MKGATMPAKKGQPRPGKGEGKSGQTAADKLKGRIPVWVALPKDEHEDLRVAAALDNVPMSDFARAAIAAAARERRRQDREEPRP